MYMIEFNILIMRSLKTFMVMFFILFFCGVIFMNYKNAEAADLAGKSKPDPASSAEENSPEKDRSGSDTMETSAKNEAKKNKTDSVTITWFGHSMFLVEIGGQKIVIDPFNEDSGYTVPKALRCDGCVISHSHFDHNYTGRLTGAYQEFKNAGTYSCGAVNIEQVLTYHDKENGKKRGENLVSIISFNNFRIAHLGDLGHVLNDQQLAKIGRVDVLMVPVGGYFTIDAFDAWEVIRLISPKIIIPMHYKTEKTAGNIIIDTLDKFIAGRGNVVKLDSNAYEIEISNVSNDEKILRFKVPE